VFKVHNLRNPKPSQCADPPHFSRDKNNPTALKTLSDVQLEELSCLALSKRGSRVLLAYFVDTDGSLHTSRVLFREALVLCSQQWREAAAKVLVENLQLPMLRRSRR
jgi:hypothetical protein